MNKAELISAAAEQAGLSKKDTEAVVNATLDTIASTLADGEEVQRGTIVTVECLISGEDGE